MTGPEPSRDRRALRAWYEPRRGRYPWRTEPPDPYAVLVSEMMLQQTQAARVAPIFERFLARFPDIRSLARASRADVLRAWAGLGYHRRAVALHRAAEQIVERFAGCIPNDPAELRTLPGVGPYTAAAVAAIAYGVPVVAMDVNVRRVVSRTTGCREDRVEDAAAALLDRRDPGSWHQAVMDLGREVCRPVPRCSACPLARHCRSRDLIVPPHTSRRQGRFAGSNREARGRVLAVLRERRSAGVVGVTQAAGIPAARVTPALDGLVRDGLVERHGRSYRLAR
jgi:A/G-specific adenine glycosylase